MTIDERIDFAKESIKLSCREYETPNVSYWKGYRDALEDVQKDQRESPRPDWTPCAEGLPEKNEAVLAIIKYAEEDSWYTYALVIRNEQDGSFDMFWGSNEWDKEAYKVIAWQPLPDPYNPDQFREPTKMMQEERQ